MTVDLIVKEITKTGVGFTLPFAEQMQVTRIAKACNDIIYKLTDWTRTRSTASMVDPVDAPLIIGALQDLGLHAEIGTTTKDRVWVKASFKEKESELAGEAHKEGDSASSQT